MCFGKIRIYIGNNMYVNIHKYRKILWHSDIFSSFKKGKLEVCFSMKFYEVYYFIKYA